MFFFSLYVALLFLVYDLLFYSLFKLIRMKYLITFLLQFNFRIMIQVSSVRFIANYCSVLYYWNWTSK